MKPANPKKANRVLKDNRFSRNQMLAFVLLFALVGSYFLYKSFAAAPLVASMEGEQMILPAGASIINDTAASGGKAVMLPSNGSATGSVNFPSSVNSVTIMAKGDQCQGAPTMAVTLDGANLLTTTISSTAWTGYTATPANAINGGTHNLSITFSNDYTKDKGSISKRCSRALYIDVSNFYGPTPPSTPAPTVTLSASPTSLSAGASATLTWASTNADSCTASGSWSGSEPTSGSVSTGALNQSSTYTLTCTGAGGSASANTAVTVSTATSSSGPLYGYSAHILRQSDQDNYTALIANGGAKTERDDWNWQDFEPSRGSYTWTTTDKLMTYLVNHNLHALILLGNTPSWASGVSSGTNWWWRPPINNSDYGDAAGHLAARYGSNGTFWAEHPSLPKVLPAGIEIWNEPNLSGFWGDINVDPAKYTGMLKAAYPAIKAADPNMMVISAGLAPAGGYNDVNCDGVNDGGTSGSRMSGLNFLQIMYQNGAAGYMDAVAYHPYNWGNTNSTSYFNYHLCSAWSQLNDTPLSVRSLMSQYGDSGKKIWATEIGAPTSTGYYSESDQGVLATNMMTKWKSYSWAAGLYWYDIRNDGTDINYTEDNFGTVRKDNSLKPSYTALKNGWQ